MIVLELHPMARKIADLIEPHLQRQGYELISVEFKQGSRGAMLRLLVDKPGGGISLNDLELLSPLLSDLLDVYDPIESRYLMDALGKLREISTSAAPPKLYEVVEHDIPAAAAIH